MRGKLLYIAIWILTAFAFIQTGWIICDWIRDDTHNRVIKLEDRVEKIHGEFVVQKGSVKGKINDK